MSIYCLRILKTNVYLLTNIFNFRPEYNPNTELCTVYYAPLNFRDIMLASGKLPPDALPGDLAGQVCFLNLLYYDHIVLKIINLI